MNILFSNLDRSKVIIDIRAKYKYLINHIPNSINIVENELLINPNRYLNYDKEYVIYCDYGNRSKKVVNYLNSKGYKVYNLVGGFNSYLNK
jgi:rhodanese-related sulfurtransferase